MKEIGWSFERSPPILRVSPVSSPEPTGINPPEVPVMSIVAGALRKPFATLTVPKAKVPSWHDRHNLESPLGCDVVASKVDES